MIDFGHFICSIKARSYYYAFKSEDAIFHDIDKQILYYQDTMLKDMHKKFIELDTIWLEKMEIRYKDVHKFVLNKNERYLAYKSRRVNSKTILRYNFSKKIVDFCIKLNLDLLPTKEWLRNRGLYRYARMECDMCERELENINTYLMGVGIW